MTEDEAMMRLALREARKGVGLTSPNPPVGAIVVKDGAVLGKGWHRKAGNSHAEIEALAACRQHGHDPKGATIYVTLEPCSTEGRTPPCCVALVEAGLKRVVWSVDDPNPAHAGRAAAWLMEKGMQVEKGVLAGEGGALLAPWAKFITTQMPWVMVKAGISLDGKITRPRGEGQWLTNDLARADAMKLRRRVDAILVGAETIRRDNPKLTLRPIIPGKEAPIRAILTRSGKLPPGSYVFTDEAKDRTMVIERKTLPEALKILAEKGVVSVLIEGGATVIAQALSQQLADEAVFYIAPMLCGTGRPVIDTAFFAGGSVGLSEVHWKTFGDNMRVMGRIRS